MLGGGLRIHAPAKVNLHLAVGATGPDGYHELTTVFQALAFGDTVTITPARAFAFSCTPDLDLPAEANLAHRAAREMSVRFDRPLGVSVAIEKRIPAGAGLGGASADAAAVIEGLAMLWGLEPTDPAIAEIGRSLGADVPFFFKGGAALFTGRGDVLDRALRPLEAPMVLVKPAEPVSTAAAYAVFDALPASHAPSAQPITEALGAGDAARVAHLLFNNMTDAAIGLVPEVGTVLALVAHAPGVMGAAVAGSGSTVFGVFADDAAAERTAMAARNADLWAVATRASDHGCVLERL